MSKVLITRSKLDGLATTIAAKSGATLPLTIAQMDAAVDGIETGGNDFIVTLSYNDQTEMWEPDKTFAEIEAAYQAGKVIAAVVDSSRNGDVTVDGYNSTAPTGYGYVYVVHEFVDTDTRAKIKEYGYNISQDGIRLLGDATYTEGSPTRVSPLEVTVNGTYTAGTNAAYSPVTVNVPTPTPSLQSKSATPTESAQTITADSGYDGLSQVTVNPIPTNYGLITYNGSSLMVS